MPIIGSAKFRARLSLSLALFSSIPVDIRPADAIQTAADLWELRQNKVPEKGSGLGGWVDGWMGG